LLLLLTEHEKQGLYFNEKRVDLFTLKHMTEATTTKAPEKKAGDAPVDRRQNGRNPRGERRARRPRQERPRSEFETKMIDIRRVTRVMAGGRRFSFSVTVVVGDGKGRVGVGLGKAGDTSLAIEKASRNAQRHLLRVPLTKDAGIPHDVQTRYASADVLLIPAPGKGLKAGSAVRTVLEMAGVRNVSGKILSRSKNKLNNARATVQALALLRGATQATVKPGDFQKEEKERRPRRNTGNRSDRREK
jgi:small subunit ribosomal protein S5